MFCLGATGAVLMLLLGFVFPAGESEAEVQTDLHTGRPAQHRGWRSGSVSPGRAVGESMTLGHCQRLCDRTRKGSHRTGMNVTWGGTHMLSTGDVQLCLHVLTTLLLALVQNVFAPHWRGPGTFTPSMNWVAASNRQCWLLLSWPLGESGSIFHSIKLEVIVFWGETCQQKGIWLACSCPAVQRYLQAGGVMMPPWASSVQSPYTCPPSDFSLLSARLEPLSMLSNNAGAMRECLFFTLKWHLAPFLPLRCFIPNGQRKETLTLCCVTLLYL